MLKPPSLDTRISTFKIYFIGFSWLYQLFKFVANNTEHLSKKNTRKQKHKIKKKVYFFTLKIFIVVLFMNMKPTEKHCSYMNSKYEYKL
jgi:hypothetical protein